MYILTNLRNIFIFTFLHNLRGAPSQPIDLDACAVCHISINPSNPLNPLQDVKMGFENLMKFCKQFNHTDSEKHLERQEQLHENYRKIKLQILSAILALSSIFKRNIFKKLCLRKCIRH